MLINLEDVGGSESGQQSDYSGHGSRERDNTWSVDGANITDNSALGAAPAYLNIAGYEELQINYGNIDDYGCTRDSVNYNLTGNLFAENILGGDHEIKFGVDYLTAATTTHDYYEGNLCLAYYGPDETVPNGEWWEAWTLRDYYLNVWMDKFSVFIQDTMTFGRLSVNLGLRYDNERSMVKDEIIKASPWFPQYMTDLSITEVDPGVAWKTFSPRFSLIYDIFGTGKDVIKLNVARYG
ncbi:unnamed protein product, partial [marine sediment metagenome]